MTTRTSSSLKQAFKRFVELVKPIEDVRHVVASEDGGHIFTYITQSDQGVYSQVHAAEFQIMRDFPSLDVLFHVRYLEGKHLDARALSPLSYSKDADR